MYGPETVFITLLNKTILSSLQQFGTKLITHTWNNSISAPKSPSITELMPKLKHHKHSVFKIY